MISAFDRWLDRVLSPGIQEGMLLEALRPYPRLGLAAPLLICRVWGVPTRPMRMVRRVERVLRDMERRGLVVSHEIDGQTWWRLP